MKFSNLIPHILHGETQSSVQKSRFCPVAGAADVGKVFNINNVCEGYSIQLHTVSAPPQPNLLFYMSWPIRQMFQNRASLLQLHIVVVLVFNSELV